MSEDTPVSDNMNSKNGNFICGVIEGFYGRPWTSEQRKDLFQKLKKWGMNSYVYAPKDDSKHRANWRDLYSVEEAEHLTSLITCAHDNGITFYYALSPGLDITYSSSKEVLTLKRKLEQVSQFGCNAFALLFDDIEPEMSEADKEVFQSFSHAQVSITNDVYHHLNQPKFLICPTQYCAARAVPNVQNSEYLSTLGSKLAPDIDIMWTGDKVISRVIGVSSAEEVAAVLKRRPLLWDNLHANDYDAKRLFLGPYQGRPPGLAQQLAGVLSNPNCEFSANFVAIHTLAQWSRCTVDAIPNESVSSDIKLETETEDGVDVAFSRLPSNMYHARRALRNALIEWLPEFSKTKQASGFIMKPQVVGSLAIPPVTVTSPIAPPLVTTCLALTATTSTTTTSTTALIPQVNGNVNPVVMNSLLSETKVCTEPMDCNATPPLESTKSSPVEPVDVEVYSKTESPVSSNMVVDTSSPEPSESNCDTMSDCGCMAVEDLGLLCDLFYLPFEHGIQGIALLQEFHWLHTNAHILTSSNSSQVEEWQDRAKKLDGMSQSIDSLFQKLNVINNKELLYELYPYVWEIRAVVSTLNSYIKWLGKGKILNLSDNTFLGNYTWFSKGWKESFMSGDQEPWVFRGGLTADLQRLIPVDGGSDLFVYKIPQVICTTIYTIRELEERQEQEDRKQLDLVAISTGNNPEASQHQQSMLSAVLKLKPEICFVVEEDKQSGSSKKTIVGYCLAVVNSKDVIGKTDTEQNDLYSLLLSGSKPQNPSLITLGILSNTSDQSVAKRLMLCALAALRAYGSCGVYTVINQSSLVELYSKLGFVELTRDETMVQMGRVF